MDNLKSLAQQTKERSSLYAGGNLDKYKAHLDGAAWAFGVVATIIDELDLKLENADVNMYTKNGAHVMGQEIKRHIGMVDVEDKNEQLQ